MRVLIVSVIVAAATLAVFSAYRWHLRSQWIIEFDSQPDSDLRTIATQLAEFRRVSGRLPTTEEGLGALVERPADVQHWVQLFHAWPLDPWKRPYRYRLAQGSPAEYDLYSLGPNADEDSDDIHLVHR